jgi:hypothetical protein
MFQFRRAPGQLRREPFICIEGDLVFLLLAVDFQNQFVRICGIVGILVGVMIVRDQLTLNLLKEILLDDPWPLSGDESVTFGFG